MKQLMSNQDINILNRKLINLTTSHIRRYIILSPNFHDTDPIINRYINKKNEKYSEYDIRCV